MSRSVCRNSKSGTCKAQCLTHVLQEHTFKEVQQHTGLQLNNFGNLHASQQHLLRVLAGSVLPAQAFLPCEGPVRILAAAAEGRKASQVPRVDQQLAARC